MRSSSCATRAILAAAMVVSMLGCRGGSQPPPPATAAASAAAPAAPPTVPTGVVVAFYGTVVPAGWVLCDGRTTASGVTTPDLRDRFVLGLDPATGAVGERGGSASHAHKGKTGEPREGDEDLESGEDEHAANDGHTHDVSVDPAQHIPPYVKLAYIMKE